jgi:hypothetical protein
MKVGYAKKRKKIISPIAMGFFLIYALKGSTNSQNKF